MIPKYPFRVSVSRRLSGRQWQENKNFESLLAAVLYAGVARRRPDVVRVETLTVLDDWSKGHPQ